MTAFRLGDIYSTPGPLEANRHDVVGRFDLMETIKTTFS